MTRRNDPTPPRVNPWTLIAVLAGCAAAISVALFLAMAYRNEAIDERNNAAQVLHSDTAMESATSSPPSRPTIESIHYMQPVQMTAPYTLPAGFRCIGGLLFKKLPNGWEQITDGTSWKYCVKDNAKPPNY